MSPIMDQSQAIRSRPVASLAGNGQKTRMTREPPTCLDLARGFFRIGLTGFGGVGPIARDVIVNRRRWLDEAEYARLVGICQVLPGANTVNVAVVLGDRYRGPAGAIVCVLALMAAPLVVLVALASGYAQLAGEPIVRTALTGAAVTAGGLVIGTAARLLRGIRPDRRQAAIAAAALVAVAILRWSLPLTLAVLGPVAVLSRLRVGRGR